MAKRISFLSTLKFAVVLVITLGVCGGIAFLAIVNYGFFSPHGLIYTLGPLLFVALPVIAVAWGKFIESA